MAAKDDYTAGNLSVLEGLDAVRKRPGMYIGSTDTAGLTHCLIEIVDNAADEASAGFARTIDVVLHTSPCSAEVADDGRGIPVDVNEATGLSGVELVLTKLHAGGKFDGGSYAAAGGLHGVGAAVVNALSTSMTAKVTRDGGVWEQTFHHGTPEAPLAQVGKAAKSRHGTVVSFTPDADLFTPDAVFDVGVVARRLHHLTHLLPGVSASLTVDGERTEFPATSGLADLLTHMLGSAAAVAGPVEVEAAGEFTERVPVLRDGVTVVEQVVRPVKVTAGLLWSDAPGQLVSYVNTVSTPGGGTHVAGLERALPKAFADAARPGDPPMTRDDVFENLCAVLRVEVPEPQFSGQTKEVLATREVSGIVADAVAGAVSAWLSARRNRDQVKALLDMVANNAKARIAAKDARDAKRSHAKLARAATLPAKLVDCRSRDIARNELLLVEGDSALGTVKGARDSETQAALPLRGKILNTARASEKQMLANAECAAIISVLGTGAGKNFNIDKLRYGKVVLLSVTGDAPTLYRDHITGEVRYAQMGELIDRWMAEGDEVPMASVYSADRNHNQLRSMPLKGLVRHPYTGDLVTVTTAYGRRISVTAGHSLCLWDPVSEESYYKPADEIEVGDLVLAPSSLPRPEAVTVLDVPALLRRTGNAAAVRVEGDAVAGVNMRRVAARMPANARADEARVELPAQQWSTLSQHRRDSGMTLATMAERIGYKQAASVSEFEASRSRPPRSAFENYCAVLGVPVPAEASFEPSHLQQWAQHPESANDHYRQTSRAAWLEEMTDAESQACAHGCVVYARNRRSRTLPSQLPVNADLGLILGWFLAEGSFDGKGRMNFGLGASDEPYLPELREALVRVCGDAGRLYYPTGLPNSLHLAVGHSPLSRVLKALGLNVLSADRVVPDLIFNADEDTQKAFLRGFFLGDGTKGPSSQHVTFATGSPNLASSLSMLLLMQGIVTSTTVLPVPNAVPPAVVRSTRPHFISITGADQIAAVEYLWRGTPAEQPLRERVLSPRRRNTRAKSPVGDGLLALPVREVSIEKVSELDVYDFSVDTDENFVAGHHGGLVAHNTDADVDGAHIRCLLLTLVYRYMRPLIEQNRVFAAVPPLHMIKVGSGKKAEAHYTYSDAELREYLTQLREKGVTLKDDSIQRYKGLGEMDADQLAETTLDPAHRRLRRVTMADAASASAMFDLCMGPDASARRDFIISRAPELDPAHLDT